MWISSFVHYRISEQKQNAVRHELVCYAKSVRKTREGFDAVRYEYIYSAVSPAASADSASAFVFFFLLFLFSRRFLNSSALSSSSSSSFSVFTNSGLYQIGGCVMSEGPPGNKAIVKWNAATNVLLGV